MYLIVLSHSRILNCMIAIIIAGGSGTRLWPLSTPTKPKHLLSLTGEVSLLQNTYNRARQVADEVYILTDKSHDSLVRKQLSEIDDEHIIVEPGRRGTASVIALALAHVSDSHDDPDVAFFHADHQIVDSDGFSEAVKTAILASNTHRQITLIGIEPDYPATGFGYIKRGKQLNGAFEVDEFREKPNEETAEEYVESGEYLWNLGLFAAPVSVFVQSFKDNAPDLAEAYDALLASVDDESELENIYSQLKSQPIDTALIEKDPNVLVVPGDFDWMDIGSYKDLHDVLPDADDLANTILGDKDKVHFDETKNTIVVTHNKPVAIIGLEDIVVVDTEEGLLVCHRDMAQAVKKAANKFNQ